MHAFGTSKLKAALRTVAGEDLRLRIVGNDKALAVVLQQAQREGCIRQRAHR
jgi:hypothetical protein